LLGSPGQCNYTASNASLDALARLRSAMGLPAMSVQWGVFAEVGLAAAQENRDKRLAGRGIKSFSPEEGFVALRRLVACPRAEVGVVRFDVRQWMEFYPGAAGLPFFAELVRGASADGARSTRDRALLSRLSKAPSEERLVLLESHLAEQVS